MTPDSRKNPGILIGLIGILAAGGFLFFMLKSGMKLPFGLHNPFAKPAVEWVAATPDEKAAAVTAIQKQLDAFDRKDYQAVIGLLSSQSDPQLHSVVHIGMISVHMFHPGARFHQAAFGDTLSDPKTGTIFVPVTIPDGQGTPAAYEYKLLKEQGTYQILSFHYPESKVPENQRSE